MLHANENSKYIELGIRTRSENEEAKMFAKRTEKKTKWNKSDKQSSCYQFKQPGWKDFCKKTFGVY